MHRRNAVRGVCREIRVVIRMQLLTSFCTAHGHIYQTVQNKDEPAWYRQQQLNAQTSMAFEFLDTIGCAGHPQTFPCMQPHHTCSAA